MYEMNVLNICPPLNMNPRWFEEHVAYPMAKYGIAVNALWPRTSIATAALAVLTALPSERTG